jgi:HAD superfamily hydrolase (TIGR01509 family)
MMKQLKALLLDVDGTLADTERDGHRVAFNRAFADAGLDWNWDVGLYGKLLTVSGGKERISFFIDSRDPAGLPATGINRFIRDLHRSKTRHYLKLLEQGLIPLRPGVERLIDEARHAGVRLAIATTTTPENVSALLASTLGANSPDWFDVIAAGDVVPVKKPAADIYFYALSRLGLEAGDCLALEDSDNGLASALGAGLRTVITVNGYTRNQDFTGAAIVLDQLGEPDRGFTVLDGDAHGATFADLAFFRRIFSRS